MLKNKQSMINQDGFFYSKLVENFIKVCKSDFELLKGRTVKENGEKIRIENVERRLENTIEYLLE